MTQRAPTGDDRYRVHLSAQFYIGRLLFGMWCFSKSAERVVFASERGRRVTYKNRRYPLRSAAEMETLLRDHLAAGGEATVGGQLLDPTAASHSFTPYPWIDATSAPL